MATSIMTEVCIVGGGPCGIMLGYLLARMGVQVIVLEKHKDFFRDFRGDTIHPSTMENLAQLGLLEKFLRLPHQKVPRLFGRVFGKEVAIADFSRLSVRAPYIALVPQWDFLNFMASESSMMPNFQLLMATKAINLLEDEGRITGIQACTEEKAITIHANLVVAADGRNSLLRHLSGLPLECFGAPMDVLWFSIPRYADDPSLPFGAIMPGRIMAMIYRGDYWQCGFVVKKGEAKNIRKAGLPWFRNELCRLTPFLKDRVDQITDLDSLKLLSVQVDCLSRWYRPGFLCIGDAAHAMSPIGGVGINLAIQDAVAAARILGPALRKGQLAEKHLLAVQSRRMWPTRMTQRFQIMVQNKMIEPVLKASKTPQIPFFIKMLNKFSFLQTLPAYVVGIGFRPEEIKFNP